MKLVKKFLIFFIVLVVLLIISMTRLSKEMKPFWAGFETTEITETTKSLSLNPKLNFVKEVQIEDFILCCTEKTQIADQDEFIYFKSEGEYATFRLAGATCKEIVFVSENEMKKYSPTGNVETFKIPTYLEGDRVDSAVVTVSSNEGDNIKLILKKVSE